MSKSKPEDVNPEQLGPGQPREVDQPNRPPLRPDQKSGSAPRPATDHKEQQR